MHVIGVQPIIRVLSDPRIGGIGIVSDSEDWVA